MYNAIVTRIKNVRPHSNADRVKLATCCGNQVVIGLENKEDELGIYFATDGQLSHEFCSANNLYRTSALNKNKDAKPGMFDDNRRVRTQKFRGEVSDGFWMPIESLNFITTDSGKFPMENHEFTEFMGVPICCKYVSLATLKVARENQGKKTKTAKKSIMFKEHFDTGQFGRNVHVFQKGQTIIITEKLHGTSGRIGHVLMEKDLTWWEKIRRVFANQPLVGEKEWVYLNGTRRVVMRESKEKDKHPYHDPTIREKAFKLFKDNLRKGETVFFEIVGYESTGANIMPAVDTRKLNDKEFTKHYGELMQFSYNCAPTQSEVYVYRMTMTNEEGKSMDYSWDDVMSRCNELGVKHVPELRRLTFDELYYIELAHNKDKYPDGKIDDRTIQEAFVDIIEKLVTGPSTIDSKHIREGVCVRIEGGLNNRTFKHKSYHFKALEGIIKDTGAVDQEEVEDQQ